MAWYARSRKGFRALALASAVGASIAAAPTTAFGAGAGERLVVGLKAFQDGFHDLAVKELRAFLKAAPGDARRGDVLFVLAQAEIARADWPGAQAALEELSAGTGERAREGRYWLGWVELKQGKKEDARQSLERYLAEPGGGRRGDALYAVAELAKEAGDLAGAARRFGDFLREIPGDPRRGAAWTEMIDALVASGQAPAARDAATNALADTAVGSDPELRDALALRGADASRAADDPKAEAHFWSALAKGAKSPAVRERARFEEGVALARAGERGKASQVLQAYVLASPQGARAAGAHALLAELKSKEGKKAEALTHLEAALTAPQDPSVAQRLLGLRKGAFLLALELGEGDRAAAQAEELAKVDGRLTPGEKGLVRLTLARAALASGKTQEALKHWGAVPPEAPQYREARLAGARTLIEIGRSPEALRWLDPLLAKGDSGPEALVTALAAAEAAGDLGKSAALSAELADRPPPGASAADYLYRRATHLRGLGETEAYTAALESLATRFPEDPRAMEAGAELQRKAFEAGDWERTLRWSPLAKKASDRAQEEAACYLEAEALYRLDRIDAAQVAFQKLAANGGALKPSALARLGAIYDGAGRRAEAAGAYTQALDAGLDGEAAAWVRNRLAVLQGGDSAGGE